MKNLLTLILLCFFVSVQAQNQKAVKVDPNAEKGKSTFTKAEDGPIEFTLRNESFKSIPLWIPGVMNPNLSPKSSSGLGLKVGQKIYFKYKGRKEVLMVVERSYNTRVFEVANMIKGKQLQIDKAKQSGKTNPTTNEMEEPEVKSKKKKRKNK